MDPSHARLKEMYHLMHKPDNEGNAFLSAIGFSKQKSRIETYDHANHADYLGIVNLRDIGWKKSYAQWQFDQAALSAGNAAAWAMESAKGMLAKLEPFMKYVPIKTHP